jgi:hypothetical protein
MNDINFPAGVLQPPLYDPRMEDAPNYGNTGGTIGHELTHAFDDEGRQFDAQGNLKDWWTKDDAKNFSSRAQCIVDQYAQYAIVDDIKINSKLTEGEDIADLGGLILARMAWKAQTKNEDLASRNGLSPEQRFFVGYAQWACENVRPEKLRESAITDPHSPGKYRVNGLVVNMDSRKPSAARQANRWSVKIAAASGSRSVQPGAGALFTLRERSGDEDVDDAAGAFLASGQPLWRVRTLRDARYAGPKRVDTQASGMGTKRAWIDRGPDQYEVRLI